MRPASIWRPEIQPLSRAWSPYSPKTTVLPRVALPFSLPLCSFRCLTRFGIRAMAGLLVFSLLAEIDPHLAADRPVHRHRGGEAVVDLRAERRQRDRSLHRRLAPRHFG